MNVKILKPTALAAIMALAACTNEVIESPESNRLALGQGEDVIRISLSNTTGTRAERPISSSEATNNVNRLTFKFLTEAQQEVEGITLEGAIDETTGESERNYEVAENVLILPEEYSGEEICVKFSGLKKGVYKIIAYGYNYTAGTDGSDAFPYSIEIQETNHLLKCENVTKVQEIFAGCNENSVYVEVNQHEKFTEPPVITLKRQVAGLLAYFKEIPVFVSNKKVAQITVSSKTNVTAFSFPASLLEKPSYNGFASNLNDWYSSNWVNYLTFDMTKASNYTDQHLDAGDYYEFANEDGKFLLANETAAIAGMVCNENTLFGSRFLLAYPQHIDLGVQEPKCATLNICYWDESGALILNVPLRSGGNAEDSLNSNSYQYDILCNNFYAIGKKSDLGGEPDDNDPISIDEPTGYDYAKVSISSDWSQSHDLVN